MIRTLLVFLLTFSASQAAAEAPLPAWIEVRALPDLSADPDPDFISNGVHQILLDRQYRLFDGGFETFHRDVRRVLQRPGLEDVGAIRIDFDPADEELIVHDIWRIRDGVRTRIENLEFLTIRRESEIDYGILDGRLTRYADIGGIRVGDAIDLSYSLRVRPEVFPDRFIAIVTARPAAGYQVDRTRISVPAGREIRVNGPARPFVDETAGTKTYEWAFENAAPPDFGPMLQDWETVFGLTRVTDAAEWTDVVAAVQNDYAPQPLPVELAARVDALEGSEAERVTAAFRIVQDEIRYMGIAIGAGGYIPRPPSLVWSRRFGDCKDKALLLVSMLDRMGIAADAALVDLDNGRGLADHPPSPYAFNHAIVRVRGAEGDYFLDPTDVLQGGVGPDIRTSDFRWALPLFPGSDRLVPVPLTTSIRPDYEVISQFQFETSGDYAVELVETTIYRGESADRQRYQVISDGLQDRASSYLDWCQDRFPGAEVLSEMTFEDDLDSNTFVIRERYGLPAEGFDEHWDKFWLNPYATKGELPEAPDGTVERRIEVEPVFHRHRVELLGQPDLGVPQALSQETPFFRFHRTGEALEDGIAATFELETRADGIAADQVEAYREAYDSAYDQRDYWYELTRPNTVMSTQLISGLSAERTIALASILLALTVVGVSGARGYRQARA
ncbi:MAG: DUF3857 domain-containing protein [Paracoccaceae bacterium]|nr:DUF3857 domain-containing protein [Paracoccaceae bacterium]